jgi:hypothetical protein
MVNRLGTQLNHNFYFIIPLRRTGSGGGARWHTIGLPVEVHRGFAGAYAYQWFFANAFKEITGRNYQMSAGNWAEGIAGFCRNVVRLALNGNSVEGSIAMIAQWVQLPPVELAIASIQGTGLAMYYKSKNEKWDIPIPCLPDWAPKRDFSGFDRFNFPMLLHVYLAGMGVEADEDERKQVDKEMAKLIHGVLRKGGTKMELQLKFVSRSLNLLDFLGVPSPLDLLCDTTPTEHIGTVDKEYDAYAAAIALYRSLPETYDSGGKCKDVHDTMTTPEPA